MKTLLTLFVLLFSSSIYAGEGDVYYCDTNIIVDISADGETTYNNEKFKFKRKKNILEFGEGGYFNNYFLDIIYQAGELFGAGSDYERLNYKDGKFYYALPSNISKSITNIIATCDIF
tara:strand:+ start:933 stop:1286 length:354 start_codon:yes stop_codon:yes gene_type:complete